MHSSYLKVFYMMRAGVRQVHAGRKPRHVLLSSSVDTVLGDVFADTTSTTSETIAAEQQVSMDPIGRSQHSAGAQRMAQSAARSGLLATWHVRLAQDICLLISLKVHSMCYVSVCLSSAACLCKLKHCMCHSGSTHISEQVQKNSWHVLHCPSVHRPHMPMAAGWCCAQSKSHWHWQSSPQRNRSYRVTSCSRP